MKKKNAPQPAMPADVYLSPADHVATVLADKDAAVAAAEVECDAARLQAFRMQTTMQIDQAEKALAEKRKTAEAMAETRKRLAADLAQRYAIDWTETALVPELGQLVAIPKD